MNIKQIAKAAGVSVATVSRVLNHPENVAPATRERIQEIMEEKEYTPNWFARGLNFNRTKTIGLVIPHTINTSNMEIANGVEEVARQKGYITFMCNMEKDPAMEREYIKHLIERKVDGIILMFSIGLDREYKTWIDSLKVPTVLIGESIIKTDWDAVRVDCGSAAEEMTKYLLDNNHKRIAIMCGADPEPETKAMLKAYKHVLKERDMGVDRKNIIHVDNNIEGGYVAMKRLLNSKGKLPDAIFSTSDEIAYGVIDAIKESDYRIPEDIAVAGFGNDRMSSLMTPKLTTIELPCRKMGIYGARILFDRIEENEDAGERTARIIELRTKLRIRKSTGHSGRIEEMF